MGRPSTTNAKTTLILDEQLKARAMIYGIRNKMTLTQVVEQALRVLLTGTRTAKPAKRQASLPLDEPRAGSEPEDVHLEQGRAKSVFGENV